MAHKNQTNGFANTTKQLNEKSLAKMSNSTPTLQAEDEGPRPAIFLARDDNTFTPLIPLDELPEWITLVGIPLYVDREGLFRTWKANPYYLPSGKHPRPYKVLIEKVSQEEGEVSDDESANIPSTRALNARLSRAFSGPGKNKQMELKETLMIPKKNQTGGPGQRYNPTTPGVLGQKLFCTHWMRTGECDFTQQGCMFLHVMPDIDTLEKLGFRSYPRWFREMPRDYQIENSYEFNESGLDPHRHKVPTEGLARGGIGAGGDGYPGRGRGGPAGRGYRGEYVRDYGHEYNPYARYGPPPSPYQSNFPAGHGFVPRGPAASQSGYAPAPWKGPSPHFPPGHSRVWTASTVDSAASENNPFGLPFGRSFMPHSTLPDGSKDIVYGEVETRSSTSPDTLPAESEKGHNLFSRDASPLPILNQAHRALTPSPPSTRPVNHTFEPAISRPTFRALDDGVPRSPEQNYTKRFQNQKPKVFSAPDAKVINSAKPTAQSNPHHTQTGSGSYRGRGRGHRAAVKMSHEPSRIQHNSSNTTAASVTHGALKDTNNFKTPVKKNGVEDFELLDVNSVRGAK